MGSPDITRHIPGHGRVAQGVRATALDDACAVARALVGALGGFNADGLHPAAAAKHPRRWAKGSNKGAQAGQQGRAQDAVAGLPAFAAGHANAHAVAVAVDVAHP